MYKLVFGFILYLSISFFFTVEGSQIHGGVGSPEAGESVDETEILFDETETLFDDEDVIRVPEDLESSEFPDSFWKKHVFDHTRVSLSHEYSYKIREPVQTLKNRSSLRVEYSKYFLNNYFILLDSKATYHRENDHRSDSMDSYRTRTTQAFLEASFGKTNIRAGVQTIAWGESQIAVITDVISPRDNRELFSIELEDLRVGQSMLTVDQYSSSGRWSFIFIPDPDFNKTPVERSAYYIDPFDGSVKSQVEIKDESKNDNEFGMRWKKTFGKSDISIMAASLIDNEYLSQFSVTDDIGQIIREKLRFSMMGMTFNYAINEFLVRGEVGLKFPQAYYNTSMDIKKKDTVDMSLGVDYFYNSTLTFSLEAIDRHIVDWDNDLQMPKDSYSLALGVTKLLMHDDLSINWLNIYNGPNSSILPLLFASYQWNDNLTFEFNMAAPLTDDQESNLWIFRDFKQVDFQIRYQF